MLSYTEFICFLVFANLKMSRLKTIMIYDKKRANFNFVYLSMTIGKENYWV